MFDAPGANPPCGMFTVTHFIALAVCIVIIAVAVVLCRKFDEKRLNLFLKISAVAVTVGEIVKISFCFATKQFGADSWLPLYFCSIFIYALWLAGYGKGATKKCGLSFLGGAGIVCGLSFLIVPSTSLASYPIYHYNCLYSLAFHSLMVISGILTLRVYFRRVNIGMYKYYLCFCAAFMLLAMIFNATGCNMMFLRAPYNMPLPFINEIHAVCPPLYTLIIAAAYSLVALLPCGVVKLIKIFLDKRRIDNEP